MSGTTTTPPSPFAAGVQALTEALRAAATDPGDQIRVLTPLAAFTPATNAGTDAVGVAIATVQTAVAAVCRRAALTSLARASAEYQPSSFNDARTLILALTALFDAEIEIAADAGDDNTYQALRALRSSVVQDLVVRGSILPSLALFTFPAQLPALVLAYRIYRDATRADDITARADPINPNLMPSAFAALSS